MGSRQLVWPLSLASLAALAVLAGGLRGRLVVVTVFGASMEPAYREGQRFLARRVQREIRRGQVVVLVAGETATAADRPATPHWLVIKRVAAIAGDVVPACVAAARPELAGAIIPAGYVIVLGDNPARSHDSRHEGLVRADRVRAVALRHPPRSPAPVRQHKDR